MENSRARADTAKMLSSVGRCIFMQLHLLTVRVHNNLNMPQKFALCGDR